MPTQRLTNEIITAAIEGFEAQKQRIDGQIAELRSILTGGVTETAATLEGTPRKRGKFSDATRLRMKEAGEHKKVGATRSSLGLGLLAAGGKMNSYARPADGLCVPVQSGAARY